MLETADRKTFFNLAVAFEGSLVLVALLLGWIFDVNPLAALAPDVRAILVGALGALPMIALLVAANRLNWPPLVRIRRLLFEIFVPSLAACAWYELPVLAAMAGVSEEILFRGFLQPALERWGWFAALVASNLIFGALHLITPTYGVLAAIIGVYLGLLLDATETRNFWTPIIAHALYDYLAFVVLVREYRRGHRG